MDTLIILDSSSTFCHSTLYGMIIDILWQNGIVNEVRAFDDEVFILKADIDTHMFVVENIPEKLPKG